jgi:hypothetical protein
MEKNQKMINKILLFTLLLLLSNIVYSQTFEGEIIYTNHFTSRIKNFTDEQLGTMIGTKQEYLIKGGNYKSFLNGQSIAMQLYDYKTNRIYNRTPKSDTLYWLNVRPGSSLLAMCEAETPGFNKQYL